MGLVKRGQNPCVNGFLGPDRWIGRILGRVWTHGTGSTQYGPYQARPPAGRICAYAQIRGTPDAGGGAGSGAVLGRRQDRWSV